MSAKNPPKPPHEVKKDQQNASPAKKNMNDIKGKTEPPVHNHKRDNKDVKDFKDERGQDDRDNRNDRRDRGVDRNRRGGGGMGGGGRNPSYGGRGRGRDDHGGGWRGDFRGQMMNQGGMGGSMGMDEGPMNMGFMNDFHMMLEDEGPKEQKKFTGRCRLFVGNITPDVTEEQFKEMFTPYGEVSELFVNAGRGFGFIRLDYRINAEKAKIELDGQMRNNRVLRVRFATHGAALKVFNLSPFVSNELLEHTFSQFGEVERAVVIVDDRGRSTGEGIVEFSRKPGASAAIKRINDGVLLMSSYPRPIRVEPLEQKDEEDGLTEKFVQRNDGFRKDREKEPRFAPPGSFDFDFGMKHRRIDDMEKDATERTKQEFEQERVRLAEEMETAMFDYQADQIRQDLMRRQEELNRLEEMKNEQVKRRQEMDARRNEQIRMRQEDDRRRQEMMMMRAQGQINQESGMSRDMPPMGRDQMAPMGRDGPMGRDVPGGRDREMMMRGGGGPPGPVVESPHGRPGGPAGPGTPPMPPPPVPPGMNMESQPGGEPAERFPSGASDGGPPNMEGEQMPRQGQFEGNQGGQFRGPPGQGNFNPPMGPMGGGNAGMFPPNIPGNMGNNPNMGGNDRRREPGRREEYGDMKRMRRY